MSSNTVEERLSEHEAFGFWDKVLAEWAGEPPIQPDGIEGEVRKTRLEMRIPAQVTEKLGVYDRFRDDLRMIVYFAVWAATLRAYSRSESRFAVMLPPLDDRAGARNVPVLIGKPDRDRSFKAALGEWRETLREAYRASKGWDTGPGDPALHNKWRELEQFAYSYEPIHGREFVRSFAQTNERKVLLHIGKSPEGEAALALHYDESLYGTKLMQALADSFIILLEQAAEQPDCDMSALELRTGEEISRQRAWNDTQASYARDMTIHGLFERTAEKLQDRIAVAAGEDRLTYLELSQRSDGWARRLQEEGIAPGDRVAVMMSRSVDWPAAFLAVLKSGAVYVPIDPAYPAERIAYMLSDSMASAIIVSDSSKCNELQQFEGAIIDISGISRLSEDNLSGPLPVTSADDLAYLLYTSGSTGMPKGVMVEHRGVSNLLCYFENSLGVNANDHVLQFASTSFDASIWEMAMALLTGGELHIATPDIVGDLRRFELWTQEQEITVATLPPTYAVHLNPERMPSLRLLVTAGSESGKELLDLWHDRVTYVNAYGPTETTVCATAWDGSAQLLPSSALVPIGGPLPNMQVHIVNEQLQPLPAGAAGELVVSGTGVARGYWNKPEMTADRFVRLPSDGTRVYRTGDLARWTPDGQIVFLGRVDRQVKIRGFRIETEEVRHALVSQAGIKEAVVAVRPDAHGEPALAAFYSIHPDSQVDAELLKEQIGSRLPAFMIPAYWLEVPSIPLTPNGKPDLAALYALPLQSAGEESPEDSTPLSDTESRLAAIWTSLLGIEAVGRDDDFFRIGGHSMRAAKMSGLIYETFQVNLPLEQAFRYARLSEMAARIDELRFTESVDVIMPAPARTGYRLSPAQTRVFTIESVRPGSTLYVMPFAFWLSPAPEFEQLEAAFVRLIERHEPLRTSFGWEGSEPVQIVHPSVTFRLERVQVSPEQLTELTGRFEESFALDKPPLLRAALAECTDGRSLLLLQLHHIIADGVSLGLLLDDLNAFMTGREPSALKLQYKDYCEWLHQREPSPEHEAYWAHRFENYTGTPDLPIDFPRTEQRSYEGGTLSIQWDLEAAEAVRKLAERCGATVHLTMLAAYCVLLSKVTGSEEAVVGSLHAGRDVPHTRDMVGMFVHTLAHRCRVDGELTFEQFARNVKEEVAGDYAHADYPFERLVRSLKVHGKSRNPLFDTMFVLQNLEPQLSREGQIEWRPHVLEEKWSRFDLVFQAWEHAEGMMLWVTYASALFKRTTVERLAEDFRKLLVKLSEQPNDPLAEVDLTEGYRAIPASSHKLDFQF
ncbi:amino acid adenylation domain-containing protein [Paenibacillus sp. YPG26]|uniref:amino acid adenylation domain-containing protein n=1 Tax=Paenibacillus sp. YPG26 TaxID=2878915 RepID=UPI00203C395B|nr:amino acid adenylation domain-containing protein [Paenibacillus sp. YPG26]USB33495.1 amino acid adenylation domain-containing protein [Paenibacillus sp. YPG26]